MNPKEKRKDLAKLKTLSKEVTLSSNESSQKQAQQEPEYDAKFDEHVHKLLQPPLDDAEDTLRFFGSYNNNNNAHIVDNEVTIDYSETPEKPALVPLSSKPTVSAKLKNNQQLVNECVTKQCQVTVAKLDSEAIRLLTGTPKAFKQQKTQESQEKQEKTGLGNART